MLFKKKFPFLKAALFLPCFWSRLFLSLSFSNIHTLLFPLANTREAAALGNEPALPVAHTSLQLLTKFHYKNLDYTGEHRGMQEHSFISRYQIEFVGQEVKGLCYALGLIKPARTHHNSTHQTAPDNPFLHTATIPAWEQASFYSGQGLHPSSV